MSETPKRKSLKPKRRPTQEGQEIIKKSKTKTGVRAVLYEAVQAKPTFQWKKVASEFKRTKKPKSKK